MRVRCASCCSQFEIPKATPGDHKWMSLAIAQANRKHGEMKPECQSPNLVIQLQESSQPLVPA